MTTPHDVLHERIGAIEELAMRRERNRIVALLRRYLRATEADYIETLIRPVTAASSGERNDGVRPVDTPSPEPTAAAALNRGPSGSATGYVGS